MSRHFLTGMEPGADGVRALVQRALEIEAGSAPEIRPGKRVVAVFLNPSLRTRTSLEAACGRLGVQPIILQPGT
ncbi:MAG: ornithine carbamoyltransferase, partial [Myxococcota bacterium]